MKVEWNKVTWYSKLAAVILSLIILCIGIYIGIQYESSHVCIDYGFCGK